MGSKLLTFSLAVLLVGMGFPLLGSPDDGIPPEFIAPGSYHSKNPDGTDPYGASHGLEIGVDVEFSHYEDCVAVYVTTSWQRPVGGGQKVYSDNTGEVHYDLCELGDTAFLVSGSKAGLTGSLIANDDGTFTADYSAGGGNVRIWHPE